MARTVDEPVGGGRSVTGGEPVRSARGKGSHGVPRERVRAGTGISQAQDSFGAGREAASAAVASLDGEALALVMVFTTPRFDLPALLAGVRSITGAAPLVGATGSGEIVRGRYLGFGAGVGVLALGAGPYRFGVASAERIRERLDEAGQDTARRSRAQAGESPHAAVILLADSLLGNLQELVQGVYRVTGPRVAIVGGAAGDEQQFRRTLVFHDDRIVEQGAVALWVASEEPLQAVTGHGWTPIGIPMLVTRAEGTRILELDGRTAADVYEEQLGLEHGALSPERFWGTSILHPFGLLQPDGTSVIRVARSRTEEGYLNIQGCLPPPGSAVQVMSGSADGLLDVVEEVAGAALAARPGAGALLTFSCAARAMIFGPRAPEEARRLQAAAGEVPIFGFYCCAEFARTAGVLATHNATLTTLAL